MILSWMLYSGVIALLLGLAAASLEAVIRQRGWPVRALWLGALAGSVVLPLLAAILPRQAAQSSTPASAAPPGPSLMVEQTSPGWWEPVQVLPVVASRFDLNPWLLGAWALASAAVAAGILISHAMLRRRRWGWYYRSLDGRGVWISRDIGPAVVGLFPGQIVLPEWVLERGAEERALVLAHEEEHLRAGDPLLLFGAMMALAALPWNLVLWWQWGRLRQAVEIDCDLRVLARGMNPRAYSRLLVKVTERGRPHLLTVAAISEPASFLERRIRLMLTSRSRWWATRAVGATLLSGALVLAACQVDGPDQSPFPVTGTTFSTSERGDMVRVTTPSTQEAAMRLAIRARHPELVRDGVEGNKAYVWMLTNSRGEIEASVVEMNPPGPVGTSVAHLERLFPVEDWKARWATGLTNYGGIREFKPGEIGPDEVVLIWWEHAVEGAPTGPYHFYKEPPEWGAEREARHAEIEQYHPGIFQTGLTEGEMLWFLVDENDKVIKTGRGLPATTTAEILAWLEAQSPTGKIKRRVTGANHRTGDFGYIKVVRATVDTG
ncbi:hypothetical protein BH23GEM6_BH23GEM6_19850 [soil metagenome]